MSACESRNHANRFAHHSLARRIRMRRQRADACTGAQARSAGSPDARSSPNVEPGIDMELFMANQKNQPKVGEDIEAAKQFGGKQDFGAPESDRIEREYASRAARA